ncbi:MAG: hypothetical protein OXJ52_10285 [Oligoflexia bacterium]|nr:hypothetical protein [Oligoflexia bacterium]
MKKAFIVFLGLSLIVPQAFSKTDPYDIKSLDPGLIEKVEAKIASFNKKGKEKQVEFWTSILNALHGDNVQNALGTAVIKLGTSKNKKNRKLWNRILSALHTVQSIQLMEYDDYDLDLALIKIIKENFALATGNEAQAWRQLLLALSGKSSDLAGSVVSLKHYMTNMASEKPANWNQLIDGLEKYVLDGYGHLTAEVRSTGKHTYDIYSEDGEKIASINAADPAYGLPPGETVGGETTGHQSVKDGKVRNGQTQWRRQFAFEAQGDTNYLSYGYWARYQSVGETDSNYNERQTAVFYAGDNPASNIDSVRGMAVYQGKTLGVWTSNVPANNQINEFTGKVSLTANFEKNTISGNIKELSASNLPNQIDLGSAEMSSNGQFSGITSADGYDNGNWEGRFYNHDSPTQAPGQVGGTYNINEGIQEEDINIQGAFGADMEIHVESYRSQQ